MSEENNLTLDEEKKLVEAAKIDRNAFSTLYEIYFSRIYNYIFRRVSDPDLADDLTSQVFMKVLENIQKFEWRGAPFIAWIYRIAFNVIASNYRKNKHLSGVDLEDVKFLIVDKEASPLENLKEQEDLREDQVQYKEIKNALHKLKSKYADIIALKFLEEKSNSEIAQILNISEGNIRIRLFRALKKLKKILDQ